MSTKENSESIIISQVALDAFQKAKEIAQENNRELIATLTRVPKSDLRRKKQQIETIEQINRTKEDLLSSLTQHFPDHKSEILNSVNKLTNKETAAKIAGWFSLTTDEDRNIFLDFLL
ncbi:MAG TPA: hypothetical protein VG895_02360 [Patescibacteria group bacterium]|nr:hypothetical protein [Patescibacteria group bacterium]